jgi:hypothetical protein
MLAKSNLGAKTELSQDCIRRQYAQGTLLLRADFAGREEIERYIRTAAFLNVEETSRLATRNRRYRLYTLRLPSAGIDAIMKVSWDNPAYPKWRRLAIRVTEVFRDRSEAAFMGALTLRQAGVPTLKPIACWTYEPALGSRESYLLYEKIDAAGSVRDLRMKTKSSAAEPLMAALERLARFLREFHQRGLWHSDLSLSNFLLPADDKRDKAAGLKDDGPIYVIDTDGVSKRRFRLPFFSKIREINALRRMNLAPAEIESFLRHYLGPSYKPSWLLLYHVCASHLCRPWRPLIHSLKRAGCWCVSSVMISPSIAETGIMLMI